ncbi:MAG TPA: hypothetical protein VGO11_10315 [Chthoniobacteraceae bacterium]|jgi:hypothetical protein|nr:hypothetical protein [Chthoniobacteraceae bacterium]
MLSPHQINFVQIERIRKIERDETWLHGERVGHPVDPKCPEVQEQVVAVVLRLSPVWRCEFEATSAE